MPKVEPTGGTTTCKRPECNRILLAGETEICNHCRRNEHRCPNCNRELTEDDGISYDATSSAQIMGGAYDIWCPNCGATSYWYDNCQWPTKEDWRIPKLTTKT